MSKIKKHRKSRPPDKYKPDAKSVNLAWDVFKLITFTALHDKHGFNKEQLEDLEKQIQNGIDAVSRQFVSIYDLNEILRKEVGVEVIERDRYRQKWKVRNYE